VKPTIVLPIALILLSVSCMVTLPLSNAQATTLSITPSTTQLSTAQIGSTIKLNLTIGNVNHLFGWGLNLTWNPQVLNLTDVTEGPFLSSNRAKTTYFTWSPSLSPIPRSQGYIQSISGILLESGSVDGSGVLAMLSFKVLSAGSSEVSIEGSKLISPTSHSTGSAPKLISAAITNGIVTVGGSSSVTPTPTHGASTPNPTTNLNPSPTPSTSPTAPEFPALIVPLICLILTVALVLIKKSQKS
jgi:hypothetical protein